MENETNIVANLKIADKNEFNCYLKEIWIDLMNRITNNENDNINNDKRQNLIGLTKLIFSKYYSLPGIIGDRLFRVFDLKKNDVIELNEFTTCMNILFCDSYEKTLRFIFDFYDFDGDGKISKEDIRVVLSYVTYSNENDLEKDKSLYSNNNINNNDKITQITKKLYESSVKNQNELFDLLEKCFENKEELIDYISFADIVNNINSNLYFMIYIFLLGKRPFSFKSIQLYNINDKLLSKSDIYFNINENKISISKSLINKSLTPFKYNKISSSATVYSKSNHNLNLSISVKENDNYMKNNNNMLLNKLRKNYNRYLFENNHTNFENSFYEIQLPRYIIDEMENIKYIDEEENKKEIEVDKEEILESESNNYEGYIYKFNNGKMVKIFFKLFYKDLFYYKRKDDKKHIGMHNLSGLFFIEEPEKDYESQKYYSFSIVFPLKKRTYFTDNEIEYKNWSQYLQIATNYSNILDFYQLTDDLGSGSFSYVKMGINKVTKEKVAVKIMDKKKMNSTRLESARTEIEIMKICQHPNIIHYIDSYVIDNNIYIVMEYCEGGTFFEFLKKRNFVLKEDLAVNLIHKLCMAIYYFHSYGITHRDLKPENILMTSIDDNADLKILDFGLGKIIGPNEKCSEPYGTIIYCAPEIILDLPYTKNVDSWSLGVITYIVLYGRLPFWDKDRTKLSLKITKINPNYKSYVNNSISDEAKNFIQNLLIKDQYKRMNIKQALEHKWFQKYNKEFIKSIWLNKNKKKNIFELYTSLNLVQ